ncbi:MAG: hypothetical protein ABIU10_01910 [Sphingomicrobium sp.]
MKLRMTFLFAAALLLSSCGSEEYPMPAAQATSLLSSLGYSPTLSTMPVAIAKVQVGFESMPDGQSVKWSFRRGRDDLGMIVATVMPSGDTASSVKVDYMEGKDHGGGTAGRLRMQLKTNLKPLFVEAVDSTLDGRPFDEAVRAKVEAALTEGLGPTMFSGVDASLDAEVARRREREPNGPSRRFDGSRKSSPSQSPTQPTSDLSRFNN